MRPTGIFLDHLFRSYSSLKISSQNMKWPNSESESWNISLSMTALYISLQCWKLNKNSYCLERSQKDAENELNPRLLSVYLKPFRIGGQLKWGHKKHCGFYISFLDMSFSNCCKFWTDNQKRSQLVAFSSSDQDLSRSH